MNITTNFCNSVKYGSIHLALKNLENENLVTSEEVTNNGRLTKVYTITEQGKIAFINYYKEPIKSDIFRTDMGNRLFFVDNLFSRQEIMLFITEYINQLQHEIEQLEQIKNKELYLMDNYQLFCFKLSVERRRCYIQMYTRLLKELQQQDNE